MNRRTFVKVSAGAVAALATARFHANPTPTGYKEIRFKGVPIRFDGHLNAPAMYFINPKLIPKAFR
jgi:hypothetical protein